jgi:hypothetical protein
MNTKKNYYLMAVMLLGMTGCSQNEIESADSVTGKQTITFVSGEETTRTSMSGKYTDDSFPFYWEKGDAIWVNGTDKITGDNTCTATHVRFTGNVTTSAPYNIIYTGTGSYSTTNSRTNNVVSTSSDASHLVIPLIQTMTESQLGTTEHFGATGDCGIATATGTNSPYNFKLNHKAAYLILMPRWPRETYNTKTYNLKSVIVTTRDSKRLLSGRFTFDDYGNMSPIYGTNGSCTIKINLGGSDGITLPTETDQTKSINIAIKPVWATTPLYFIYEVSDGTNIYYIEKIVKDKSFAANTVTSITANLEAGYKIASDDGYLNLITNNNIYYNFYEWDAPAGESFFVSHEKNDDYNNIPVTADTYPTASEGAKTDWAKNSNFQALPTFNQISWYVAGRAYWDANKVWGPGADQKGGMWFKKKKKLIADGIVTEEKFNSPHGNTSAPLLTTPPSINELSTDWFFLPATGSYDGTIIFGEGIRGYYWLCTPQTHDANSRGCSWCLGFSTVSFGMMVTQRDNGMSLWQAQ